MLDVILDSVAFPIAVSMVDFAYRATLVSLAEAGAEAVYNGATAVSIVNPPMALINSRVIFELRTT
jgi:hypothetical protein